MTALKSEYFSR